MIYRWLILRSLLLNKRERNNFLVLFGLYGVERLFYEREFITKAFALSRVLC